MKYNLIGVSGKIGSGKDLTGIIIQYLNHNKEYSNSDTLNFEKREYLFDYFKKSGDFQIKKFADKLKQRIAFTWNIDKNKLEDQGFKNTLVPELGITWRELMQLEGSKMRDIDEDYWVKALFVDYKRSLRNVKNVPTTGMRTSMLQANFPNWIITDVRYPNEADTIIDKGGIVIRVNRPKNNLLGHYDCCKTKDGYCIKNEKEYCENNMCEMEHESETALDNYDKFHSIINNNGTIEELVNKIKNLHII